MSTILVTGASGLIGNRLINKLKENHDVVAMSRKWPQGEGFKFVNGDFTCWEDLTKLDQYPIDSLVHLAAVTGGPSSGFLERECIRVNVEGTRVLMRYLASHGCKKMVLASSIAAVGLQREDFIPDHLPITEEHICKDRDGYGFSKYMMEEITRFINQQKPDLDIVNIRLSGAQPNDKVPELIDRRHWFIAGVTFMHVDDAVKLFTKAVEAPHKPGLRIVNGVSSRIWSTVKTADQLRHWFGDQVDVSWFEQPGNEYACFFDSTKAKEEFGFEATKTLEILKKVQK